MLNSNMKSVLLKIFGPGHSGASWASQPGNGHYRPTPEAWDTKMIFDKNSDAMKTQVKLFFFILSPGSDKKK